MVSWLKKECQRAARVDNSVQALKRLHSDFQWPFPLLLSSVLANINNTDPAKSVDELRKSSNNSSAPSQAVSRFFKKSIQCCAIEFLHLLHKPN